MPLDFANLALRRVIDLFVNRTVGLEHLLFDRRSHATRYGDGCCSVRGSRSLALTEARRGGED